MTTILRVAESGWMTTIQDVGRLGHQRKGVAVGGALDVESLELANRLVGNPADMGAVEVAYMGPVLVAETGPIRMAVVGAQAKLERRAYAAAVTGTPIQPNESFVLAHGEALKIGALRGGSVLYIAVEGGFDIAPVLGSIATDARGRIGGWNGRALAAGDRIPLNRAAPEVRAELRLDRPSPPAPDELRVLLGPQADYFTPAEIDRFLSTTFTVSSETNRMGMRLNGGEIAHARGFNITSDAVTFGSIQIMGNGQPLILMADRPTTGGYPKIATIISADLPAVGRMQAGSSFRFRRVTIEEAHAARVVLRRRLEAFAERIGVVNGDATGNLYAHSLISGFVDALDWSE